LKSRLPQGKSGIRYVGKRVSSRFFEMSFVASVGFAQKMVFSFVNIARPRTFKPSHLRRAALSRYLAPVGAPSPSILHSRFVNLNLT